MNSPNSTEGKVQDLTREVLAAASPKEVLLLNDYDPTQSDFGAAARGPLGFGTAEAGALLLPVVYALFQGILKEATSEVSRAIVSEIKNRIKSLTEKSSGANEALAENIDKYLEANGIAEDRRANAVPTLVEVIVRYQADLS